MPLRRLFVSVRHTETDCLLKRFRDDLQSSGETSTGEAARNRDCRQAGEVKRIGKTWPHVLFVGVHAFEWFRWTGRARDGEDVDFGKVDSDLFVQDGTGTLRSEIIRGTQEGAFEHSTSDRAAELQGRLLHNTFVIGVSFTQQNRLIGFARQ